ncbi:hypothetical protein BMR1_01G01535 [Babesia microti strain RI]|uniref:Uncharacterized protein n=1 Tax=Babesia microti (strain RI) TaxID=1133968 RepID=I7I800_BABMR|nr:hypothetical protein BMR1_01G01535 [Babesia microti strain RI]CCF72768.1 hypothetical protein BMR1_01G01535 [Babesia microti strain RI]|eukprot:XP_012647377.1 hypothetical protein BMR1_01G01535 [Babesia microti strain RI]
MADSDQFCVDNDCFNEALYLDHFLKTTGIEDILEKKRQVEYQLNCARRERDKILTELEFQIVNGIKNINKLANDSIMLKSQSKLLEGDYQRLLQLDKPYLMAFNNYINEYKLIETKTRISCMYKIPMMIKCALESNDVTRALLLLSNAYSISDTANYPSELKDICSQLIPTVTEVEKMIALHIIGGSYLPTESLYQYLTSINVDLHKSQTLHILNYLNMLDYHLKIIANCDVKLLFYTSKLYLNRLDSLKKFISNYKRSNSDICMSCAVKLQNYAGNFEELASKLCKDGEVISDLCLKCHLSPMFAKLLSAYKSEDIITVISKAKSLDPHEFNYCIMIESLKSLSIDFESELELIGDCITSNLDMFINNLDSHSFNPIFNSIKKSINNANNLYNWVREFTSVDPKLTFLNVCSNFVNNVIKIFCHIIMQECSLDNDKRSNDEYYAKSIASINYHDSLLKNYVMFNPYINPKHNVIHSKILKSAENVNNYYIINTNRNFLHMSLKLIISIKTLLLPQIIDYMNTTFNHFDSKLEDINLYHLFNVKNDCKQCKNLHFMEVVPFDNPKNSIYAMLKFLVSELLLNSSIETAIDLSKKITSIYLIRSKEPKGLNSEQIGTEICDVKELLKRRLANTVNLLEPIPINNNSTFSLDKHILSHKMYINIDPMIDDRHRLIEYHVYLVVVQIIECLRSEYINSSALLDKISRELAKVTIDFLATKNITLSHSICDLWHSITKCIHRTR